MASITVTVNETPAPRLIAPPLHTVLLIALFLVLAVGGAFFQRHAHAQPEMLQQHPEVAKDIEGQIRAKLIPEKATMNRGGDAKEA